jgi:hypothetical protein
MHTRLRAVAAAFVLALVLAPSLRAQHPAMPSGMTHEEHLRQLEKEADLKKRGEASMGFDQDATTHHFTLTGEGGRIEVTAKDPSDAKNLTQIRAHLTGIATAFANGNFDAPFGTHGEVPPGVTVLQELRGLTRYRYENIRHGGRVVMSSANPKARAAIHDFLRYQIREHATGDPLAVVR